MNHALTLDTLFIARITDEHCICIHTADWSEDIAIITIDSYELSDIDAALTAAGWSRTDDFDGEEIAPVTRVA